ncbi:hypothetical protein [Floridanema evergladense]|uniref:Uncharacterized protein n=1 Tax=Floridaenema evergladense BLCC-F167 TaxID=3153639 RepID=A0ABV4WM94_9CYAN
MTKEITADDWKLVDEIAEEVLEDFLSLNKAELDKFEDFIVNPKKLFLHYCNYNSEHDCKVIERDKRCRLCGATDNLQVYHNQLSLFVAVQRPTFNENAVS